MSMAERIQHLRKSKGISQEDLADKIGVSRQSVSKWESAQSSPDIEKVILLSEYFGTTTDYLLKGSEPADGVFRICRTCHHDSRHSAFCSGSAKKLPKPGKSPDCFRSG